MTILLDSVAETAPSTPLSIALEGPPKCEIAHWLHNENLRKYRNDYRRFRLGYAGGARGDVSDVGYSHFKNAIDPPINTEVEANDPVTRWRIAYRRFRLGEPNGAKGSVPLSIDSVNLLPIVQGFDLKMRIGRKAQSTPVMQSTEKSPLHVHFGCGKLGVGLILPALVAARLPFVMVQSNRGIYKDLAHNSFLQFKVNDEVVSHLRVFRCQEEAKSEKQAELLAQIQKISAHHDGLLFVLPENRQSNLKELLINQATSLSTSIGPGIAQLAGDLSLCQSEITLYACENDHAAVEKLSNDLKAANCKLNIQACMVDRICPTLQRTGASEITSLTEVYAGEIVMLNKEEVSLPFNGPTVRSVGMDAQANYFAERKFLLVNGGHTVLAFLTLVAVAEREDLSPWTPPGKFELLHWNTCNKEQQKTLWAFSIARILLLLWEYDTSLLRDAHRVSTNAELCEAMLDYAKSTVTRFGAVKDFTDRILGGGVNNRYLGRLKNIEDFLSVAHPHNTPIGKLLLAAANTNYCAVVSYVHKLVEEAHQFTRNLDCVQGINLF